ncbi:hypothetical protein SNEBB_009939 [Seison nebaliae]|nr:hypothetical protein SNEBB_009939 [Seison nebaliae]
MALDNYYLIEAAKQFREKLFAVFEDDELEKTNFFTKIRTENIFIISHKKNKNDHIQQQYYNSENDYMFDVEMLQHFLNVGGNFNRLTNCELKYLNGYTITCDQLEEIEIASKRFILYWRDEIICPKNEMFSGAKKRIYVELT